MSDEQELSFWKFLTAAASLVLAFLGYEFFRHLRELFAGLSLCIGTFWKGLILFWGAIAGTMGGFAASVTLLSCVVIPVTTVSIYTIFRKAEERPRAFIVALGLFLDPLFIDFFKDKINEEHPIQKMLLVAVGIVTFLVAMGLWSKAASIHAQGSKLIKFLMRTCAVVLFLFPTLCILGYLAIWTHNHPDQFAERLTRANEIGLVGLVLTAVLGIALSRFYEAP